ncbi:type 1 fimbrial protein [Serratia nevei]|uniref:fimbrial protein n=1 Tax=Serratia nevei TaxID=2703794 RepID=UPI0020A12933|nr:fimbrial protein [Serratia nevei]MCP1107097.1 type 1 fimbrial protein [Serratia nevei]
MNKRIYHLISGLLACAAFSAQAADGSLRLSSTLVKPGCSLSVDSQNATVDLGEVLTSKLQQVGAQTTPVEFNLRFTDCVQGSKILIGYEGNQAEPGVFALNDAPGSAKGIGLQIDGGDGVNPHAAGYLYIVKQKAEALSFLANYKALSLPITPGKANATVQFNVTYL